MESLHNIPEVWRALKQLENVLEVRKTFGFHVSMSIFDLEKETIKLLENTSIFHTSYAKDHFLKQAQRYHPVCYTIYYQDHFNKDVKFSTELYLLKKYGFREGFGFPDIPIPGYTTFPEHWYKNGMRKESELWKHLFHKLVTQLREE